MNNYKIFSMFLTIILFINSTSTIINAKNLDTKLNYDDIQIIANNGIVFDPTTETVLYNKNMNEKKYPASITKLMTVLLTLENVKDLDERITFSDNAVFSIPRGSSHISMNSGETLTVRQALYAVLLASANEVSNALAEHISGDTETFAKLMTKRAKELGALNTNFVNANGLHDDNHYITAYDMALITKELLKYPIFKEIIHTQTYTIPPTEKQKEPRIINNSHRLIKPGKYYYKYAVGGKTGYTTKSEHTLVTYAKKDDIELIVVLLDNHKKSSCFEETIKLLDRSFSQFNKVKLIDNTFEKFVNITQPYNNKNYNIGVLNVIPQSTIYKELPKNINKNNIKINLNLPQNVNPPIRKGQVIGEAIIKYNNYTIDKVNLISNLDVKPISNKEMAKIQRKNIFSNNKLIKIFIIILGIIIITCIFTIIYRILGLIKRKKYKKMLSKRNNKNNSLIKYRYK